MLRYLASEATGMSEEDMRRGRGSLVVAMMVCVALAATSCTGSSVRAKSTPSAGLSTLSSGQLQRKFQEDIDAIRRHDRGLRMVLAHARDNLELFERPQAGEAVDLTAAQREELREIWRGVLDYMRALDGIKHSWGQYRDFSLRTHGDQHRRAFLVGYLAWLVQYHHGLDFMALSVPNEALEVILDEEAPAHQIPAGSFARLKFNVIHASAVARLHSSRKYRQMLGQPLACPPSLDERCRWAHERIENYHALSEQHLARRGVKEFAHNSLDIVKDGGFQAWFPVQARVAEWMGDTKVRRLDDHLIQPAQIQAMIDRLQPGDIIVARHNWYLSNVGLPGFWPHAELYLGSHEELAAYFDAPEIHAWFQQEHGVRGGLVGYLEQTYPQHWQAYLTTGEDGQPRRVIEAISEGVTFSSLEKAAAVDYAAALRPRVSRLARARAVARSFSYVSRPYDYNFDFLTDETLVCTELVYKSWRPAGEPEGLELALLNVMGRTTLPANEIVRQYDLAHGTEEQALEFVFFLDGREKQGDAVARDEATFRESWRRPKWDVLQQ